MYEIAPAGPFDLANQTHYFGDWIRSEDHDDRVIMAFPVEGWAGSAAVTISQREADVVKADIHAETGVGAEAAWQQALAALSLDIDGSGWPDVGTASPVIGRLQERYGYLRPVLFHTPYEAAAAFVIGHRIRMTQRDVILQGMREQFGAAFDVAGQTVHAFPLPRQLVDLREWPGLSEVKLERLRAVAAAAVDGRLDRARLRSMTTDEAMADLQTLPGVGPFFAQGILYRGAGVVDEATSDEMSRYSVQQAFELSELPKSAEFSERVEAWAPYRMWAMVLLHVWIRREIGLPSRRKR